MIIYPKTDAENAFLKAWLEKRLDGVRVGDEGWCLGVTRDGRLSAVAGFNNYRTVDIELLFASDNPRWATKQVVAWILAFPFIQLKCQRCTAMIARSNKRARKLITGVGFREEGAHRHAGKNLETMLSYGMTRMDYFKRYGHYGKEVSACTATGS